MAKKLYEDDTKPSKSQAKEVNLWHERISIAKKDQETWAEDSGAKRFTKEYEGEYGIIFNTRRKNVPIPPINEVFAYVQSDIATTYNRDPYITVNAEAGTPKGAALWETIINYYWRVLQTKEEIEYEIIDKDLVGYAFHKVGMSFKTQGSGEALKIDDEKLYSNWLRWKDVVWNIGSKRPPKDCEWMAQRIVKSLDQIKKQFPKAKDLEGSPNPDIDQDTYKKSMYKDDIKVGTMWEIWSATDKKIYLIAEGLKDEYLEEPKPWPEYLSEFPFLMYWDFAIPAKPRPMSAIAPWEAQILAEMVLMGQAINHAKRWNRQMLVNNSTIDENTQDKFERGDDGAILSVTGKVGNDDVRFVDFGPLPTDFYLIMDRLQAIKRKVNGQPEFVQGGVTKTQSRTIGELQLIEKGATGRQDRKIDRLETHCENIARHMLAELKGNFDFEQTIKIVGETPEETVQALGDAFDPQTGKVTFTPQDIQGEYDVEIKAGSTLPLNKENRIQTLEIILNTVAQAISGGAPMSPFLNALIQEILKDDNIKSLQEAYELEVQMAQQAQQEKQGQQSIEDQKTAAETAKRHAQAQQIEAGTQISVHDALMQEPEGHKVSESISFKDLPEEGRVQLAAQAGIHLTPEQARKLPPQPPVKNGVKP